MTITADTVFGLPVHVTRNVEIGKPLVVNGSAVEALFHGGPSFGQHVYVHPLDHWRLRHWEEKGLSDLEVLERWYVEEVDRRLRKIGLEPPKPTITYSTESPTSTGLHGPHVEGSVHYVIGARDQILNGYRWERRDGVLDWHHIQLEDIPGGWWADSRPVVTARIRCTFCGGTGRDPYSDETRTARSCPACRGRGVE